MLKKLWNTPLTPCQLFGLPTLWWWLGFFVWGMGIYGLSSFVSNQYMVSQPPASDAWWAVVLWFVLSTAALLAAGAFWLALAWKNAFNAKHALSGYLIRSFVAFKAIILIAILYGLGVAAFERYDRVGRIITGTLGCMSYKETHSFQTPDEAECDCQRLVISALAIPKSAEDENQTRARALDVFGQQWMVGCMTNNDAEDEETDLTTPSQTEK